MSADLSTTIEPKSDQLNADDLIAGPRTIRVTKVVQRESKEQPIDIHFEGDAGKPYKPNKTMRRVLVYVWGKEGSAYVGRSMTLYRDPAVKWGGDPVGGIKISHMSDIKEPVTIALTVTKGVKKPHTAYPLVEPPARAGKPAKSIQERVATFRSMLKTQDTETAIEEMWAKASKLREEVDAETLDALTLEYEARLDEIKEPKS